MRYKVNWFKNSRNLNEIYQQTGTMFAFASLQSEGITQCHEWVKCRDFLPDVVKSQITGKAWPIYGFAFDPKKNPNIDFDKIRMLVSKNSVLKQDKNFERKIESSLKLLNHFEDMIKEDRTEVVRVDESGQKNYKSVFLFSGPSMWLESPFLVSMYTFLIRLGDKELEFENQSELEKELEKLADLHKDGKLVDNDAGYLRNSWNKLELVMKNYSDLFKIKNNIHDVYSNEEYSISSFHNSSGFNSLAKCYTMDTSLNTRMKKLINKNLTKK